MLDSRTTPALSRPSARELSEDEVSLLYSAADYTTKQLIFLLLNGVSPQELLLIDEDHIDLDSGRITIPGNPRRGLTLPASAEGLFTENDDSAAGWKGANEIGLDMEELDARLQLAALEGKLPESHRITALDLRHTYLLYLVKQGIRLSELEGIVGKMPSKILLGYRNFTPDEADKSLDEISTVYPLFT
jgi:integrase